MKRMRKILFFMTLLFVIIFPFEMVLASKAEDLDTKRTDTEDGYRIDYVDEKGKVVMPENRGYASIRAVVNEGVSIEEYYLDANGEPIAQWAGHYGVRKENFDEEGNPRKYVYIDYEGKAIEISSGFSCFERNYDDNGYAIIDFYFDLDGNPTTSSYGEYGTYYLRDDEGNTWGIGYLDVSGNLMMTNKNFAIVLYDRDSKDRVIQRSYFGPNGEVVTLGHGQHAELVEYDNDNNVIDTYYRGTDGKIIFVLDEYLMHTIIINVIAAVIVLLLSATLPNIPRKALFILYTLFVLYMTVIGRVIVSIRNGAMIDALTGPKYSNVKPFDSYRRMFEAGKISRDLFNNILLFVPYGALVRSNINSSIKVRKFTIKRPGAVVLVVFITTLSIEIIQYFTGLGLFELDDLINNTMGGVIGWLLFELLMNGRRRLNKSLE